MPKRKVAVTQEQSRVLRETEENPFGEEEEEAARAAHQQKQQQQQQPSNSSGSSHAQPPLVSHAKSSSISSSFFGSSSKSKSKDKDKAKGKRKPFNLEAEKEQMKSVIAEASIASTNLMNSLQSINRERERISSNQTASAHFETCKLLRRRVLRYVSFPLKRGVSNMKC